MQPIKLTTRAQQCLERGSRSIDQPCPLEVGERLVEAGYSAFDPVIETFTDFGGYWHPIGVNGTFRINTVQAAIKQSREIGTTDDPTQFKIPFGVHPRAQFEFLLDGHGTIFADSIPICESAVKWIESYAMQEMVERWKNCVRIDFPEPESGFASWANQQLRPVQSASGKYGKWWLGSEWAINRFLPWTDEPREYWNWIFATTPENGKLFANKFTDTFGLETSKMIDWPYV